MADFKLDDYVSVAERIRQFHAAFPEGTLQSWRDPYLVTTDAGPQFMVYSAAAYRTPDDPRPGIGWAWEMVPGKTSFTRESELQNAETAAWGRAIVALGAFEVRHVASRDELERRNAPRDIPDERPAERRTPPASVPGRRLLSQPETHLLRATAATYGVTSSEMGACAWADLRTPGDLRASDAAGVSRRIAAWLDADQRRTVQGLAGSTLAFLGRAEPAVDDEPPAAAETPS